MFMVVCARQISLSCALCYDLYTDPPSASFRRLGEGHRDWLTSLPSQSNLKFRVSMTFPIQSFKAPHLLLLNQLSENHCGSVV